jgi:hypothetical protein
MEDYVQFDDSVLAALANPGAVRRAAKLAPEVEWPPEPPGGDAPSDAGATLRVAGFDVRLDGRGPGKARCPCPAAGICVHALAAAMAVRAAALADGGGRDAPRSATGPAPEPAAGGSRDGSRTPAETATSGQPNAKTWAVTRAVRTQVRQLVRVGLSHVGAEAGARLADLASDARTAGLPLLSRYLLSASGRCEELSAGGDEAAELEVTSSLAAVWALTEALERSDPESWPKLRGAARRVFDEKPARLCLEPLGVVWWTNPSGACGLTFHAWDTDAGTLRTVVAARPGGVDRSFHRSLDLMALWDTRLGTLLEGAFLLNRPRMDADGSVSPTGTRAAQVRTGVDEAAVEAAAAALNPGRPVAGLTVRDSSVALFAVRGSGRIVIDEPAQELVWVLEPAERGAEPMVLRQPITGVAGPRIDAILALDQTKGRPAYVMAVRAESRGRAHWEPVTVFLRGAAPGLSRSGPRGGLSLLSLDFRRPSRLTETGAARQALALAIRRWRESSGRSRPDAAWAPRRPPVAICCDEARELVVESTATGRTVLSPEQIRRRDQIARRCDALALATLADAIRQIGDRPDPGDLLRAHHLADRAATLAG